MIPQELTNDFIYRLVIESDRYIETGNQEAGSNICREYDINADIMIALRSERYLKEVGIGRGRQIFFRTTKKFKKAQFNGKLNTFIKTFKSSKLIRTPRVDKYERNETAWQLYNAADYIFNQLKDGPKQISVGKIIVDDFTDLPDVLSTWKRNGILRCVSGHGQYCIYEWIGSEPNLEMALETYDQARAHTAEGKSRHRTKKKNKHCKRNTKNKFVSVKTELDKLKTSGSFNELYKSHADMGIQCITEVEKGIKQY